MPSYALIGHDATNETPQDSALISDTQDTASSLKRSPEKQRCSADDPAKCHVQFVDGTHLYSGLCRLPRRVRRERLAADVAADKCTLERQSLVTGAPQGQVVTSGASQSG